jgi:RNA polymerase sigma-70 factor, ECF subfamily
MRTPVQRSIVDATDRDDIRASLGGDPLAYARLIRRHQQAVAQRLRHFTSDPLALEELVQEVFVEAYYSLERYRGEAPLLHWLSRIATRVGYRFWKRRERQALVRPLAEAERVSVDGDDPGSDRRALLETMRRLSPRDRLVLTLMYLEERPVAEVADLTGWSQSMVKVQAMRARQRLRKLMSTPEA